MFMLSAIYSHTAVKTLQEEVVDGYKRYKDSKQLSTLVSFKHNGHLFLNLTSYLYS